MRIFSLAIVLATIVFTACEKTVVLDTDQAPSKIVIEGLITNQPGYQYVKISRSVSFYEKGKTPRVTDAVVQVEDDLGSIVDFIHNPNGHEDSVGYYKPSDLFAGEIGRIYKLTVQVSGQLFEAEDKMLPVTTMDSLTYQVNDDEFDDPETEGKFYEVMMYAKEPQDTKDYYLFHFFRNDSLITDAPSAIYYSDDVALGEEINGIPSPVFYGEGDTARVEMYSLSRRGFVFYNDLFNILNNDGGMYSPPPANSRTNLSNGAVGFFQVSAVDIKGIKIE